MDIKLRIINRIDISKNDNRKFIEIDSPNIIDLGQTYDKITADHSVCYIKNVFVSF